MLIQPIKYHAVMRVKRLCEIGASHFGLTFNSSILNSSKYSKLTIIPEKNSQERSEINEGDGSITELLGFLSPNNVESRGYYNGYFGDLLRALKEVFKAKIIIEGNVLKLEREDYNNSAPNYPLPPVDQTAFTLNSDEFMSNYVVRFQTDENDKNTLQNYYGTLTQVTTTPKGILNRDMVLMSGLEIRSIPFSRATTKTDFTQPEKIIKTLATVFDPIVGTISDIIDAFIDVLEDLIDKFDELFLIALIGAIPYAAVSLLIGVPLTLQGCIDLLEDLTGLELNIDLTELPKINYTPIGDAIEDRIGTLLMENDFISVPKLALIEDDGTVDPLNDSVINSLDLYDNFHYIRSFVPSASKPNANQYLNHEANNVPFCFGDYVTLRNSNKLQDSEGETGEIVSSKWNVRKGTADHKYRINKLYDNNLKEDKITLDGK